MALWFRYDAAIWAELGDSARDFRAALNRPWFESALAPALASVPEVADVLQTPGARIADIGCGAGWSTIALRRTTGRPGGDHG